jgi:hypothetical protein
MRNSTVHVVQYVPCCIQRKSNLLVTKPDTIRSGTVVIYSGTTYQYPYFSLTELITCLLFVLDVTSTLNCFEHWKSYVFVKMFFMLLQCRQNIGNGVYKAISGGDFIWSLIFQRSTPSSRINNIIVRFLKLVLISCEIQMWMLLLCFNFSFKAYFLIILVW